MSTEFLSDDWLVAMDAAASVAPDLAHAGHHALVIQNEVVDGHGSSVHHVRLGGGEAHVRPGPAPAGLPTVRIHQDRATATAIAAGELSAQRAFMTGRLRIGGDLAALIEHTDALALLHDVFADVRSQTVMSVDGAAPVADPPGPSVDPPRNQAPVA